MTDCQFCMIGADRIIAGNEHAIAIRDLFPISPGHTLIIPRRHVGSWFDAQMVERVAMLTLADVQKAEIDKQLKPDSYNLGINDGPAAGQTISHLHLHLIPRFTGDVQDARGGIRWLIPSKAAYWTKP
jgi:diadenosine tetraphosphate (Ap4A) HIT family hydrolase